MLVLTLINVVFVLLSAGGWMLTFFTLAFHDAPTTKIWQQVIEPGILYIPLLNIIGIIGSWYLYYKKKIRQARLFAVVLPILAILPIFLLIVLLYIPLFSPISDFLDRPTEFR